MTNTPRGLTISRPGRHHHHQHQQRHLPHVQHQPFDIEASPTFDGEEVFEASDQRSTRLSHRSSRSSFTHGSSLRRRASHVVHDRFGRPIRAKIGHETFGDIVLHPIKEFEAHRQRIQEFKEEREHWEQEHHLKAAPVDADAVSLSTAHLEPMVRCVIHFRHLMGDQKIRITDDIVDKLKDPLLLTDEEILALRVIKDTDDLIDFFHQTRRMYSLKIHKAVPNKKREIAPAEAINQQQKQQQQQQQPSEKEEKQETQQPEAQQSANQDEKPQFLEPPAEQTLQKRSMTAGGDMAPIVIDLSENVYLEIKFYLPDEEDEERGPSRRPIFMLPDPDLSDEIGEETSATWLELFGDVFYVGILATFTHEHHIVDQEQLGIYASWFVVMWWTWCASALYSSRYDNADVVHHIYKVIELCGLVGMAGASSSFWENPRGFIIGYMVMKAVLLIEYSVVLIPAIISGSKARTALFGYVSAHALALLLWGISLLYPDDRGSRFGLWYVSIFMEVVVHMFFMKTNEQVSLGASHLGERFALFTIIVLGENCMGFIRTVMETGTETRVVIANMFGLVIIFLYFFMYFDDFSKEVLSQVRMSQLWMYLHFPLHLCQVAFGIALSDTISIYAEGGAAALLEGVEGTAAEHSTSTLIEALAQTASAVASEESPLSHIDPSYVYKSFWVAGGLILILNALIKLVNTEVEGAKMASIVCTARVLNAVIFFALTSTSYETLDGLAMLGIMAACLGVQACIDLLD